MSIEALNWAWKQTTGHASHKVVLVILADRAGFDWTCWPSQKTIAEEAELTDRQVRRILASLEGLGLISREKRYRQGADGGRTSDLITLSGQDVRIPPEGLPDISDRVTGHLEQGYRTPVSGQEPSDEPSEGTTTSSRALEVVDGRFDTFWGLYPRKVDRKKAQKIFDRLMKTVDHEAIIQGLEPWLDYWEERGDPSFIPYPTTWLNNERWMAMPPPLNGRKVSTGTAALMKLVGEKR